MTTVNTYLIIEWQVDPGPPRTVQHKNSTPYSVFTPDNGAPTDPQILGKYIKGQPDAEKARLTGVFLDGLLTLAATGQWKATAPALPQAP
jgi:hypothetical protein